MSQDNVLPIFRSKTVNVEYERVKGLDLVNKEMGGIVAVILFLPVLIGVSLVLSFIASFVPGLTEAINDKEGNPILSGVFMLGALGLSALIFLPVVKRLEAWQDTRTWHAQDEDEDKFRQAVKEQGFTAPNVSMSNMSRAIIHEDATGVDFRIMSFSRGVVKGKQQVHMHLSVK